MLHWQRSLWKELDYGKSTLLDDDDSHDHAVNTEDAGHDDWDD